MKKLLLPLFISAFVVAVSCGASEKKSDAKGNHMHATASINTASADTIEVGKVEKTEEEWKKILTPEEYHVLREGGTEPAFSSELLKIDEKGIFYCAACGLPLYSSETKFESGTGWPSFWKPITPQVVKKVEDRSLGAVRIEIECAQCGSHIGHVFKDGPEPTGLRYCMNGLALDFKPAE